MNLLHIIDFYYQNSLQFTGVNYDDKLAHLGFFAGKSASIDVITDYCTQRALQGVKNATINRELTIVRSAINYYNKHHDNQVKNPVNGFKLFESDYLPRYLTPIECKKLLSACRGYAGNDQLYHFVNLLLNTGCRSGEPLSLTWNKVHIDNNHLTIINSLSKNRRTVHKPLNNPAVSSLQALQRGNNSKWVFYNDKTNNRRKTFRKGFLTVVDKSGIGAVRIHDLRHTFASILV